MKSLTSEEKEEILKETLDLINLSLKNWHEDQVIYPVIFPESIEQITKYIYHILV